jgi:hypothetical protein
VALVEDQVKVVEPPAVIVVGLAVSVTVGAGVVPLEDASVMTRVTSSCAVAVPDVPTISRAYAPGGADADADMPSVFDEKMLVTPFGTPAIVYTTLPLKPFCGVTVITSLAVEPVCIRMLVDAALRVKLGVVTVNDCVTGVAAAYDPLPAWDAMMVQVPAASNLAVAPVTLHTVGVVDAKLTGSPELAVATRASEVAAD